MDGTGATTGISRASHHRDADASTLVPKIIGNETALAGIGLERGDDEDKGSEDEEITEAGMTEKEIEDKLEELREEKHRLFLILKQMITAREKQKEQQLNTAEKPFGTSNTLSSTSPNFPSTQSSEHPISTRPIVERTTPDARLPPGINQSPDAKTLALNSYSDISPAKRQRTPSPPGTAHKQARRDYWAREMSMVPPPTASAAAVAGPMGRRGRSYGRNYHNRSMQSHVRPYQRPPPPPVPHPPSLSSPISHSASSSLPGRSIISNRQPPPPGGTSSRIPPPMPRMAMRPAPHPPPGTRH
ncbi:uncharacterized protein VTP21DRAFT_5461 [Calcarisporiella thermophila]|uniref:uncharacterized protein n=1 Tax=Calcarisporiella thermophila TaxID=911321 RepID=UPI0037422129